MPKCSFKYCKHVTSRTTKTDGISYFRFPRDPIRRGEWVAILSLQRREQFFRPKNSYVVCSKHFSDEDMYVTDKGITRLHKSAIPRVPIEVKIEPIDSGEVNPFSTSSVNDIRIKRELHSPTHSSVKKENLQVRQKEVTKISTKVYFRIVNNFHEEIEVPVVGGDIEFLHKRSTFDSKIERELNSPTSSVSSAWDTPREFVLKCGLKRCQERLIRKEKDIRNLVKKNSRLVKNNIILKNTVKVLKKRLQKLEPKKTELEINK